MLNVVVVDDEALVRVGLKSMINWEENGFQVVGEASNGQQGLETIKKYKPDLVITDIKMPVMDGLDMIRAAVDAGERAKFIILSSYDEFNLVRQAMKLGASEYLIKLELEPDSLIGLLAQVKSSILKEREESERKGFLEMQIRVNKPVVREEFFRKLIGRVIRDRKEIEENIRLLEIDLDQDRLICGCIKVIGMENLDKFGKEDMQLFDFSVINIVEEILNDSFKGYCFKWGKGEYVFVLSFSGEWEDEILRKKVEQTAERLIQMLKQYFSISASIGISDAYSGLSDTAKAFLECTRVVDSEYAGIDKPGFFRDLAGRPPQHNNRMIARAKKYINEHIGGEIKLNELAEALGLSPGYLSTQFKQATGQNFVDYVTTEKVNYAKLLLKESNLKIYEVSDMLGYENAYYFSRVFKKVTGMTPSEYLSR